jgi:hypothetical protein
MVWYLFRHLQNMYSNKSINFRYLRGISSLSSADTAVRKFVSFLELEIQQDPLIKTSLSAHSIKWFKQFWALDKFFRNNVSTSV